MRRQTFACALGTALALTLAPTAGSARSPMATAAPDQSLAQYDGVPDGPYGAGPYGADGSYGAGPFGGYGDGQPPDYDRRGARSYGGGSTSYRGFHISDAGDPAQLAAIEHQIDIVESVGLSRSNLRMLHHRPIRSGYRSHFDETSVIMGDLQGKESRPVLLHEFMHIYHRQRLPGGFNNPTIIRFYNEAVSNGLYPSGSYVLKDRREFFAMTASAYLNGTVARPPFNRETIAERQPAYYAYLAQLFGPR